MYTIKLINIICRLRILLQFPVNYHAIKLFCFQVFVVNTLFNINNMYRIYNIQYKIHTDPYTTRNVSVWARMARH